MVAKQKITSDDAFRMEQENNQRKFVELLKLVRPDLYVLMDILDQTNVNWFIITKIVRALNNVALGSGWGEVRIEIKNGRVLFVRGEDTDRLDEPLILSTNLTKK